MSWLLAALRGTYIASLQLTGTHPRIAQAAARHSKIDLTMRTYADPVLLDVQSAIERLPIPPLPAAPAVSRQVSHSPDAPLPLRGYPCEE
jgi:hypothetical protein